MAVDWELRESGPPGAERTVLLLPGGMCSAGSYEEVMGQPVLAGLRLVAATLPGHAGTAPPDDFRVEHYAELTADLVSSVGADVVVGFSMGASVALEMVTSGRFTGPTVLLGVSLSPKDEPAFFRALVRLTTVAGSVPSTILTTGASSMVKRTALPPERQQVLRDDFRKNVGKDTTRGLREYVAWLGRGDRRAETLCATGIVTWVVHAEKGDGGLTDHERRTLDACASVQVVTIPGSAFFLVNEVPAPIADVVADAARHI